MKNYLALILFLFGVVGCKVIDEIKKELYVKITTISPDDQVIGQKVAALYGDVTDDGGKTITEKGIVLSRNPNPTVNDTKILAGYKMFDSSPSGMGKISVLAENLIVNTKYYYKAYCINSLGTSYGVEYSFTTKDLETPKLTTELNGTSDNSITVSGVLSNTDLVGTIISYGFYYSLQTGVKDTDPYVIASNNNRVNIGTTFSSTIPSLTDGTNYFIKSFVKTSKGISLGPEISTKTLDSPTKIGLRSGLQVFYSFSGNANDESGNQKNGVVTNATLTKDRYGNANSAYYFNGVAGTKIQTSYSGVLGSNARTVSIWSRRPLQAFNGSFLLTWGTQAGGVSFGLYMSGRDKTQFFGVDNGGSTIQTIFNSLADGNWHHYLVTFDPSWGKSILNVKMYIDGVFYPYVETWAPKDINTLQGINMVIGEYSSAQSDWRTTNGDLDDVGVWNRVLTNAEIQYLFKNNFKP